MANFIWFYMIMLSGGVCCLSFTSIGSTNGDNIFECNVNVTLVCKPEKGQASIVFKINDIQAANCVHQCYVNTPILGNYTLSHDFDGGIIRLDIHKVSAADASNKFTCEGDLTTLSIKPVIKVFPEKSSTSLIINETNSTNLVEIKALTGCVLLQANLTFVWNKTRNSNGSGLESLPDEGFIIKNTELAENSKCIPSDHCGGEARSSTLTFTEETNGGVDYYITCTIVINENVIENTHRNYTIISKRAFAFKVENAPIRQYLEHIPCWSFGIIFVGVIIVINIIIFARVCFEISNTKPILFQNVFKGARWAFGIIVPVNLVIVLMVRFVQKPIEDSVDRFPCWAIFLIILVLLVLFVIGCLIWIILDPVSDAKIISRTVTGNTMTLKIALSARLYKLKAFYAQFESEVHEPLRQEMKYSSRLDGSTECLISGLSLGYYQMHVHSYICHIRSLGKTVVFDKKGRALPPQLFTEDKRLRTETSVSLKWTPTKGQPQQFFIIYKTKKSTTTDWEHTQRIKENSATIDRLKPGTTYLFKILAVNNVGPADESNILTIRTNAIKALPPENFAKKAVSENEVMLSWNPNHTIKKQEFILKYCNLTDAPPTGCKRYEDTKRIPYDGNNIMYYTLQGLRAGSDYSLEIFTRIGKRTSANSQILFVKTEGKRTSANSKILHIKTEGKYDAAKYDDYPRKENLRTSQFELQAHEGEKKLNRPISEF